MGLIIGAIFAVISVLGASLASIASDEHSAMASLIGAMFGVGAVVFLPIMYGVMGFIFGALTAALYNLVAGLTGGIALETQ